LDPLVAVDDAFAPDGVETAFHRSVAEAIESLFELGPCGRNESVHDEFAVGAVEDYHASPGAGEHREIFTKPLCFEGKALNQSRIAASEPEGACCA